MRPARAAAVVFLAVAAFTGSVRPGHAADKWVSVRSQNFLLVGNASEKRIRELAGELERFRAAFAAIFPNANRQSSTATTVVVFKNDESFQPYKPLYQGKPANVAGYFQPGADINYIALNGEIESPTVIYHEFVHSLTRDATRRLPTWVSEGLAEFYSTFRTDPGGRNVELGRPLINHIALLRERLPIPLDSFLAVDPTSPHYNEQSKQGIFYAQSWALVHYLEAGRNGSRRAQFAQYLSLVAGGKPIDQSFQEAFHADYAAIEKELREYLQQFTMTFFRVPLPEKLEVEQGMERGTVSEAQAAAYLGDMMVRMGRADAAEKELTRAMALDPTLADSYVSMGMLRLHENKDKEAAELLSRAVQGDSRNYLAHYIYAQLLQKLAAGESEDGRRARLEMMQTHIKKAIALAPHFVDAYRMLGFVAISLHTELLETEEALLRAVEYAPGREDLRLMLATVLAVDDKEVAARTVATSVRDTTTDARIRRDATNLVTALQAQIDSAQATVVAGLRVEGFLTLLECDKGMNLHVQTEKGMVLLHSDAPATVNFVSHVPTLTDSVSCGAFTPAPHVIIGYKRADNPAYLGEPLTVEFRP